MSAVPPSRVRVAAPPAPAAMPAQRAGGLDDGGLHDAGPFRALGFRFAIRSALPQVVRYLERVFAPLAAPGPVPHRYLVEAAGGGRYLLHLDGELLLESPHPARVTAHLIWHVNRMAVERTPDKLLVHASAAEHRGRALLLPAAMESGKSTLVAGLVRAGLRYLTDETVALDPETLTVDPYPRAISLDRGSWSALPGLRPVQGLGEEPYAVAQWQVDPRSIRPGAVAPPSPPAWVIVPRYERGAETVLVPMSRAEAVAALAENAFNFRSFGARGLAVLAAVAGRCECRRLTIGDLEAACREVLALVDGPVPVRGEGA